MDLAPEVKQRRDRFFQALLNAAGPLQNDPDPEVTMEALIAATEMLRDRLVLELDELRQEKD
jgi:hypothetical protein